MKIKYFYFLICGLLVVQSFSCRKPLKYTLAEGNQILSFSFLKADNPGLPDDVHGIIQNDSIFVVLSENWQAILTPTFTLSDKAFLQSDPGAKDFSQTVTYTVESESGAQREYKVVTRFIGPPDLVQFKINGIECPYDQESNTFYFPASPDRPLSGYTIHFDTAFASQIELKGTRLHDNSRSNIQLTVNDLIEITVLNQFAEHTSYQLLITGLPLVQLTGDADIGDDYKPIHFRIIDPEHDDRGGSYHILSDATIKIRGGTSRAYPKKNYAFKTKDEQGEDKDVSILGLRSDQSWILDAMYIDKAKMRNRVCTDIWNQMNNVPHINLEPEAINGTRGYLTEVFLNDEYRGVYMLTEKVDRKQLKVKKKRGFVYKAESWTEPVQFSQNSPFNNQSEEWDGWEIKYPDLKDDRPVDWTYLSDMVDFASTTSDQEFMEGISDRVDVDNFIDYFIFINAVEAEDNAAKNTFFSIYDTELSKKFFYTVWDLDATLGRTWNGKLQITYFYFWGMNNRIFKRLLPLNPDNFVGRFKDRWNHLKNNELHPSNVQQIITHYKNQLELTNAAERESLKWPGSIEKIDTETEYMMNKYQQHYLDLDDYINGL